MASEQPAHHDDKADTSVDNAPADNNTASPPPPPPPIDDPLANGLKALFDPSIRQTTDKLTQVYQSQMALSGELDGLISQLQHYLDSTKPPSIKPTVAKLASTTQRLAAVNILHRALTHKVGIDSLQNIQQRLNKAFVQLSKQRSS